MVALIIEIVRIPEDRKAVLIGRGGISRKKIERSTMTMIEFGDCVEITGDDPLLVLKARDIVTAIGRGFTPKQAMRLLDEDCLLRVISLEGEKEKKRQRLFGRVIGKGGRCRKTIESETGALICIRGKTLSLIGTPEELEPAEEAVGILLAGKTHGYAYKRMHMRKPGK